MKKALIYNAIEEWRREMNGKAYHVLEKVNSIKKDVIYG